MNTKKKMSTATQTLLAMLLGAIFGMVVGEWAVKIQFIGTIWLNMIRMFLVPTVVCMVVRGIANIDSPKTLGRVGLKIVLFYLATTFIAAALGIIVGQVMRPGIGFVFEAAEVSTEISSLPTLSNFMLSLFSSNIFESFSSADMLKVLIASIIIGIGVVFMPEDKREPVRSWFSAMADMVMSIIGVAMKLAPIGVFCLMAAAMGQYGISLLGNLSKLLLAFYVGCILHFLCTYCVFLWANTGITPLEFMKKGMPTFSMAISSCSSAATVPVNLTTATENFGCSEAIAGFSIPLGSSMNQDGGAILGGVVMLFCAQAIGVDLSFAQIFNIVVLNVLVTSGSSGVPGGGIMRLMVVAAAMNLPLEIIAIIGGVYRLFDMGTTSMSVMGDLSATIVIDRWEKKRAEKLARKEGRS